jgi:SAM-dependent methyltransferase
MIARRATSVAALEPVPDMQRTLRARCAAEGVHNVEVLATSVFDLSTYVPARSIDSALILQSLHHLHRRKEVFAALGAAVRPGGRLFLVEPHHNALRAARLFRQYLAEYRAPAFWTDERNWATHDFLTRREIRALCRLGGFEDVRITGYWIPFSRRLLPDARRRFRAERLLGSIPGFRHVAAVLAVEARRSDRVVE